MLKLIHTISFLLFVFLLICSCSKDEEDENLLPPDDEKEKVDDLQEYLFFRKEVIDFKAFRGSEKGGVDVTETESPESFWNEYKLADYYYDTLRVTQDSIHERPYEYEINSFRYEVRHDSIYRWNRYADFWEFYGIKKNDTIEHYVCFYNFQKASPPFGFAQNGHDSGEVNYYKYFNDNEYNFASPSDMKNKNDEVAWYNIKYVFVRNKGKD